MQKQKSQYRTEIRQAHERIGAFVLLAGTLIGTMSVSHEARRAMSMTALRPAFAVIEHSTKESETMHMPVRFDQALRGAAISGKK